MTPTFSESQHAELRAAWAKTHVSDLLKSNWNTSTENHDHSDNNNINNNVITINSTTSADQAFDILVKHNINAAPVWDSNSNSFIGMVSMLDVVEFVLMLVQANKAVWQEMDAELDVSVSSSIPSVKPRRDVTSVKEHDHSEGIAIAEITSRIRQVKPIPVSCISDLAQRDPFISLSHTATLDQAIDIFSKGIHRIVITKGSESNHLIGILTQSDLIRYLNDKSNEPPFDQVLKMRLNELKLSQPKDIVYVKSFQPVLEALQTMHSHRVSSVAVVDPTDRLLGNISASDVKHIMRHLRYGVLFETCSQFIGNVKTRAMLDNMGKDIVPVIQVSSKAILFQVIRLLYVTKVHRVWCTEQDIHANNFQSPVAVISLTDIIRVLM